MKPVNFDYARPADLSEAVSLASNDGVVKFIAGGQSLGPMLNLRLAQPDILIDLTSIEELKYVENKRNSAFIGACVTHADIEDGRVPDVTGGAMRAVAAGIAYRAVRNRGTIGGSLVHADPSADWISALAALGAEAVVRGRRQDRRIRVDELMTGAFETGLAPDEILVGVEVPRLSTSARWGYFKYCRKTGELAQAVAAFLHDPDRDTCRAVIGATGSRPVVFGGAEDLFSGGVNRVLDRGVVARSMSDRGLTDPIDQQIHFACLTRAVALARNP